ncbi:hypothetical protein MP228_004126 [Amoeboaphelidium protococcarum]|nr:hypothetical protein MP228_004126 [Amoeboaphelidium protococcarum]
MFSFGQPQQQQQQQQPYQQTSGFGAFSFGTANNNPQQQQQQPQQQTNLFAGFGAGQQQNQNQQQQQSQQQQQTKPLINRYTKFNDLPQEVQSQFEQINKVVNQNKHDSMKVSTSEVSKQLERLKVRYVNESVTNSLVRMSQTIDGQLDIVKGQIRSEQQRLAETAEISYRMLDSIQQSLQQSSQNGFGRSGTHYADVIHEYYMRFIQNARQQFNSYRLALQDMKLQVDQLMVSWDGFGGANGSLQSVTTTPECVTSILQQNYDSLLRLSAQVSSTHQQLMQYANQWQEYQKITNSSSRYNVENLVNIDTSMKM